MPLPTLTHLQFLVIAELLRGAARGRDLRTRLRAAGVRQSGPGFYQMMATLEDAGFVSGRYDQQIVDGQIIRERHYKVLASGMTAWKTSRDFYQRTTARRSDLAHGT
jgi:DNA-binding PadR family transcriptional regulator